MSESYDLVVIGGGLAGTVAVISVARMGARMCQGLRGVLLEWKGMEISGQGRGEL
ncbi:MAG: hypothetical protein KAJ19_12705 [Gammaproteobacteria bacterium]|nr:hypothetical protein [Gammaproteobacteria bacterium]